MGKIDYGKKGKKLKFLNDRHFDWKIKGEGVAE